MYYAAGLDSNPAVHCLGVARSLRIEGPYNDSSSQPWICPEEAGGAIDASGFLDDDNRRYVVYKIDGPAATNGGYCANSNNKPSNTSLMLVETTNNGYDRVSGPINLYNHDGLPDRYNIEAPSLIKSQEGIYFLFFSHGCYTDNSYGTSYVTSTNIQGPYGDRNLLIQTGDYGYYAPGGADVTLEAPWQMVFHSSKSSGTIANGRVLNTATLRLVGRTATIV